MRLHVPMFDQLFGLPLIVVLLVVFLIAGWIDGLKVMTLALLALNALSCRRLFRGKVVFFVFNLTFFFFLVGRTLAALLLPEIEEKAVRPLFDLKTERLTDLLIFISILVIRLAFSVGFRQLPTRALKAQPDIYVALVRRWSGKSILVAMPFNLIVVVERVLFVSTQGYEAYYTHFSSEVPLFIARVGMLYEPLLFLYLATFPARRATYMHLLLYLVISATSLGYGQRNGLVFGLAFIFFYLALRDIITPSPKLWLSRKLMLFAALITIPLISFLAAFTFYRSGVQADSRSIVELILGFFVAQGSAIFNLSHTIDLHYMFSPGKFYSVGPVLSFFKESIISQALFGVTVLPKASAELALDGHNFSFALAYLVNPDYYARGGGYGSNYIAELWIDFGITGVVLGSAVYGFIMARFVSWIQQGSPFTIAFLLAGAQQLIYAPRSEFVGFLSPVMSMLTLAVYLVLHVSARRIAQRRASRAIRHHQHSGMGGGNRLKEMYSTKSTVAGLPRSGTGKEPRR